MGKKWATLDTWNGRLGVTPKVGPSHRPQVEQSGQKWQARWSFPWRRHSLDSFHLDLLLLPLLSFTIKSNYLRDVMFQTSNPTFILDITHGPHVTTSHPITICHLIHFVLHFGNVSTHVFDMIIDSSYSNILTGIIVNFSIIETNGD